MKSFNADYTRSRLFRNFGMDDDSTEYSDAQILKGWYAPLNERGYRLLLIWGTL